MQSGKVHIALNKPPMYICTSSDPEGRPLALDLIPAEAGLRLFSVGRLDFMSCGLVLFTNDGDFAAKLGHPRAGVEKEYMVEATGHIPDELLHSFENGVNIEGERYRAKSVRRVGSRCVKIVLVEGRNREIRRVFSHFRLHPLRLRRIRIGSLYLGDLAEGQSRRLGADEVAALLEGKESVQYGSRFDRPGEKPQALQSRPRPVSRSGEKSLKPKKELTW
jgi:23S rRNA pseudouridine2605 synthase